MRYQGYLSFLCFRFENVPLVTPNGDILVNDLSFEVNIRHWRLLIDN